MTTTIERARTESLRDPGSLRLVWAIQGADGFDPVVWAAARKTGLDQLRNRLRDAWQRASGVPAAGTLWCQHEDCVLTETEPWPTVAALAAHEHAAHGLQLESLPQPDDGDGARRPQQLVIVDDNMHLRSMRHACYKVAAEEQAAFVTMHITAPLDTLLARNAERNGVEYVPEASLRKIYAELEPPAVCTSTAKPSVYWERDVVKLAHELADMPTDVDSVVRLSTDSVVEPQTLSSEPTALAEAVWPWLLQALGAQPSPAEVEQQRADAAQAKAAARKESQAETAASLGVAVDGLLRKLVGAAMGQAKAAAQSGNGPAVKDVAGAANKQRKLILQRAKDRTKDAGGSDSDVNIDRESLLSWCEAEFTRGLQEQLQM